MSKTWIKNAYYLFGPSMQPCKGDLLITDGRIMGFSPPRVEEQGNYQTVDGSGCLISPGLINSHTHVAMSLFRGYAGGLALGPWLNDYIWPAEARLSDEDVRWGAALGILEMLSAGVTCFADMYDHMEAVAEVVASCGIRADLCRGMIGMFDPEYRALTENDALFDAWHGAENDRIRVSYGPHAPNTCPPAYLEKVADHARLRNAKIHIHLAETMDEVEFCQEEYGMSPTEVCLHAGLFERPSLAAHGIYFNEKDLEILAAHDLAIVHNPVSNMKLASGSCRLVDLRQHDIPVAIGTDGASSNNNLSVLKDVQIAALHQKLSQLDAQTLPATEAIQMATIDGAKALRWDSEIGSIELGKKADLVFWDLDQPHFAPWHDPLENFVYAAQSADVYRTMVDGRILYENGEFRTLDREKIMSEATKAARKITKG